MTIEFAQPGLLPKKEQAKLRLGIIGLGNIGRVHYENLLDMAGAEVTSIAEPQSSSRENLDENVAWHEHWTRVLCDPAIEAVVITLPHALHASCAEQALQQGKHVFLEKPLAATLREARLLVERAKAAKRILMVNMTHRFYPTLRMAHRMLREGVVGDVITIHDHYMEVINRAEFPSWFFDPHLAGGGVTLTDSIHLLDRVSWLIGEPLSLEGQVSRTMDPASRVEDCSELICRSQSGIAATIGSFFCFSGAKTWADRLVVYGSKGTLVVHAWSHLEWTPHAGQTQRIEAYPPDLPMASRPALGHRAAMEEFISAIREDRTPEAAGYSVINAHMLVQEFYDNLEG